MPSTIAPVYSPLGGNTALLAGRVMAFCAEKNKKALGINAPVAPPAPLWAALRRMMYLRPCCTQNGLQGRSRGSGALMSCNVSADVKKDVSTAIKKMLDAPLKRRSCRCKKGIYRHHIVSIGEAIPAAED